MVQESAPCEKQNLRTDARTTQLAWTWAPVRMSVSDSTVYQNCVGRLNGDPVRTQSHVIGESSTDRLVKIPSRFDVDSHAGTSL
jgi:hypothetical protein